MYLPGKIKDGQIVLDHEVDLPEGAAVRVELVEDEEELRRLKEGLARLSGTVEGLPEDMAERLDYYIYGTEE